MALLPPIKRFLSEDFPDQQDWIGKLLYPLNLFLGAVYGALNKGITWKDNISGQISTIPVNGATPTVTFKSTSAAKPTAVWIGNVTLQNGNPSGITLPVTIDWTYSSGQILINNITNLNPAFTYNITFLTVTS